MIDYETQKSWWSDHGHFNETRYLEVLEIKNPSKYRFFMYYFFRIKVK
jgi:hypothetical protein